MSYSRWLLFLIALGGLPVLAPAATIPTAYRQVSSVFGLPSGLLYAIALTESARPGSDGRTRPWPWTLNVSGAPHYYPTRSAACHALRALIGEGRRNIDIGLMQINWRWHHKRLITPCGGLAPTFNLRIAAHLLSHCFRQSGDWWIATGQYHDPGRDRASLEAAWAYRGRVLDHWRRITTRITNAQSRLIWIATAPTSTNLIWVTDRDTSSNLAAGIRGG